MILMAFFLTHQALAAPISLSCVSYSGEFAMRIEVREQDARIDISRSSGDGSFDLPVGKIELQRRQEATNRWIGFAGNSSRHHHVTFRVKHEDLAKFGEIAPNLFVSADWTDAIEIEHSLRCQRQ